jgi:methylthioribose-1-phosphate isomerase
VFWRDGAVVLLDQRRLPDEERWTAYDNWEDVARAITEMEVRGAPAIGCAAAFAAALAWRAQANPTLLRAALRAIGATRPTAVNLGAALHRIANAVASERDPLAEAQALWAEDLAACRAIGAHGAALVPDDAVVLTHCNAGALATSGYGTALGVIRGAVEDGKRIRVLADETRPFLQGARLTAWELQRDGIPVEIITDGMAGHFLSRGEVSAVIVGADRIAANGDTANKIGTYSLAVLAKENGVPFYVAAPMTTLDLSIADGAGIPIEERSSGEVTSIAGVAVAPAGVSARHPAFDITPARYISAVVTERGVHRPPFGQSLPR